MIAKEVPVVAAFVVTVRTQECLVMFVLSVNVDLKCANAMLLSVRTFRLTKTAFQ